MAGKGLRVLHDGVTARLESMVRKGKDAAAFLNRVAYPEYQNYQMNRWMVEGPGWAPLNPRYASRKRRMFASSPGAGQKTLIATGKLVASVIGPAHQGSVLGDAKGFRDHRKVVSGSKLTVSTVTDYAQYVDEKRDFSSFSAEFKKSIAKDVAKYMLGAKRG